MKDADIYGKNSSNDEASGNTFPEECCPSTKKSAKKKERSGGYEAGSEIGNADGATTTLEMRPPLKLLTVEEAKEHMKGNVKAKEGKSSNDKNED